MILILIAVSCVFVRIIRTKYSAVLSLGNLKFIDSSLAIMWASTEMIGVLSLTAEDAG